MKIEAEICPYCQNPTQKRIYCDKCNGQLVFNNYGFPINVSYVDWEWNPQLARRYRDGLGEIVENKERDQNAKQDLIQFIMKEENFPRRELISISEFKIFSNFEDYPVIQVWCRRGAKLYQQVEPLANRFGIYLHLTGPPMPSSPIKRWLDSCSYFKEEHQKSLDEKISNLIPPQDNPKIWLNQKFNKKDWSSQNSFLLSIGGFQVLLDAGFTITKSHPSPFEEIPFFDPQKIKLVILSHAHNDHSQGLWDLYEKGDCSAPIICTQTTLELYLIKLSQIKEILKKHREDVRKNAGVQEKSFLEKYDQLQKTMEANLNSLTKNTPFFKNIKLIRYEQVIKAKKGLQLKFFRAGHLPGAIITEIILNLNGNAEPFRILYTGDFSLSSFEPIPSARQSIKKIKAEPDVIICDATAADKNFKKEEAIKAFVYSQMYQTLKLNSKRDKKSSILVLSDFSPGIIIPLFIFHEMAAEAGMLRPPFYFNSDIWDLLCVFRDSPEDLSIKLRNKINKHEDPFHSIMIRKLGDEWLEYGGIGLNRAINEGSIICLPLSDLEPDDSEGIRNAISEETFHALENFLSNPNNLLIISGKLRHRIADDLISGRPQIRIRVQPDINRFINVNCKIFNTQLQNRYLFHFHPDFDQLLEFLDYVMPQMVILFHSSRDSTNQIRTELTHRIYCIDHDHIHRSNASMPLSKRFNLPTLNNVRELAGLRSGMVVWGLVKNIQDHGAYIDIGVGPNGLAYKNHITKQDEHEIKDYISINKLYRFEVKKIDLNRNQFSLSLKRV